MDRPTKPNQSWRELRICDCCVLNPHKPCHPLKCEKLWQEIVAGESDLYVGFVQNTCHGDFCLLLAPFIIFLSIHLKLAPFVNPCIVPKFCSIKNPSLKTSVINSSWFSGTKKVSYMLRSQPDTKWKSMTIVLIYRGYSMIIVLRWSLIKDKLH